MRVDRTVVGDVERAVGLLEEAYPVQGPRLGLAEVWNRTKHAMRLADRAFFNPNMVGLLYFVRPPSAHQAGKADRVMRSPMNTSTRCMRRCLRR